MTYLTRRGQRYYFRMRVPVDLFPFIKQRNITLSLGTSRHDQAKRRVRALQAETEQLFTTIRIDMLDDLTIQRAIARYKDRVLRGLYRHRERDSSLSDVAIDPDVADANALSGSELMYMFRTDDSVPAERHIDTFNFAEAIIDHLQDRIDEIKTQLRSGRWSQVRRMQTHTFIRENALPVETPPDKYMNLPAAYLKLPGMPEPSYEDEGWKMRPNSDFYRVGRALLRADADILQTEIDRMQGNDTDFDRKHREKLIRPEKKLSELCTDILEEQKMSTKKTSWMKVEQHHKALLRVMGDKFLRDYNEWDIRTAADTVKKWPKKAATTKGLDGIPAADIVKRTDLGDPISYNMIKARLTQLCSTFKRALELDLIDRNPCPPLSKLLPVGKPQRIDDKGELIDGDRHLPWSNHEILSLLGTSYCTKAVHRVRTPENFWLPILAIFTGSRLNELAQLYCDDLLQSEDGRWLMRITRDAERKQDTKNDNSVRRVPIHHQLIELGLLRYRDWIESQGHERLFPNLPYFPTVENFSNGFSKRIGHHFKRHISWEDPNQPKTFHGLRSTFIQTLRDRNGVHEEHIRYLVGHAAQHKMTAYYGGAKPVSVLDKHLQRLDYGIDFVRLLDRWEPPKK